MTYAWIFFGVVGALTLNALYQFGVWSGVQLFASEHLPAGNLIRRLVLHPTQTASDFLDVIAENPVRWATRTFAISNFGGGFAFSVLEKNVSFFDGLWWAHVTVYTVGYGDLSPVRWIMRILAMGVIAGGFWSLAIMQSALTGRISARQTVNRLRNVLETEELHDDIEEICSDLRDVESRLSALGGILKERETNQKEARP